LLGKISGVFLILLLVTAPMQAYYSFDLEIWSSPYRQEKIYTLKAGALWPLRKHLSLKTDLKALTGPWRLEPEAALLLQPPLSENTLGRLAAAYNSKAGLELTAGFETLADPLLTYFFFSCGPKAVLDLGLNFAVNERWAVGAHLHYTENSLLTYQLHHFGLNGLHSQVLYSRTLDGTLQRLGLKFGF